MSPYKDFTARLKLLTSKGHEAALEILKQDIEQQKQQSQLG